MPEVDRWGIQSSYEDYTGTLRSLIGEAGTTRTPLVLRRGQGGDLGRLGPGELRLEDGTAVALSDVTEEPPLGYHRHVDAEGRSTPVIVAPARCHLPDHWRAWGWVVQLYATRSKASWGM